MTDIKTKNGASRFFCARNEGKEVATPTARNNGRITKAKTVGLFRGNTGK